MKTPHVSQPKVKNQPPTSNEPGRNGAGVSGQNWVESPQSAREGRNSKNHPTRKSEATEEVDTDISQAV